MLTLGEFPVTFLTVLAVTFGLFFGSFLNVVIYRLPRGESVVHPGSRCPGCGKAIRAWHNIPVLGWLLLRGRASCCGAKISARYPLVEALGGLTGWAVLQTRVLSMPLESSWYAGLAMFTLYFALALGLIAAALIDLEHMILPDEITLGGTVVGLGSAVFRPDVTVWDSFLGAALGFVLIWLPFVVLYRALRGQAGMGLGDAKLTLLAGAWFGWQGALFAILAGSVQGTVAAVAVYLARGRVDEPEAVIKEREEMHAALDAVEGEEREALLKELELDPIFHEPEPGLGGSRIPFGPFLVLATLQYILFGPVMMEALGSWLLVI